MIPSIDTCYKLWDKYKLSEKKRIHVQLVAQTALYFSYCLQKHKGIVINIALLEAGALLHDIDKNIEYLPTETHPQTGVRILRNEGYEEVAELIKNHSVQNIENEQTAPKTWEEKLLFLADKMVKQDIITVDERFDLWLEDEYMSQEQKTMLRRVYPHVKSLEYDICSLIGVLPGNMQQLRAKIKRGIYE